MIHKIVIILATTLVLAGCATEREKYDVVQTALEGSPQLRSKAVTNCVQRMKPTRENLETLAALARTSTSSAKRVVCQRMIAAISSKRMTYADLNAMMRGRPSPKVIRILQGR